MRVVVSAEGADLSAPATTVFGRCPVYVFVDSETLAFEAVENPAANAAGGAGIQAAQFVVERGAEAVLTGNVGPNAVDVFRASGVPVYTYSEEGSVGQVVQAFREGRLPLAGGATVAEHGGVAGGARHEELVALEAKARELRRRLAEIVQQLDELEKGVAG